MGHEAQPLPPPKRSRALTGLVLATSLLVAPALAEGVQIKSNDCVRELKKAEEIKVAYLKKLKECPVPTRNNYPCRQDLEGLGMKMSTQQLFAKTMCSFASNQSRRS